MSSNCNVHLWWWMAAAIFCLAARAVIAMPTTTPQTDTDNPQSTNWTSSSLLEALQHQYPILLEAGDSIPEIKVNIDDEQEHHDHGRHTRQVSPFAPTPNIADYILFANRRFLVRINPDGSGVQAISLTSSQGTPNAVGIDYDIRNDLLFWSDVQFQKIFVSHLNGSNLRTLVSTGITTPDGIAYDWINHKLYWTDTGDKDIEVIDLVSGNRKVLFQTGPLSMPRGIVVDPINRFVYWTDWGQPSVIERASMDGTNPQTLHTGLGWPNGLTIDLNSQTLYWVDALLDRIESSNTDGNGRTLLTTTHVYEPYGIDVHQGTIYRTDWLIKAVLKAPVSNPDSLAIVISNLLERPYALRVVSFQKQPFVPNFCLVNACSYLCLLSSTDPRGYSCCCPAGQQLSTDQATCVPRTGGPTSTPPTASIPPPSSSSTPTVVTTPPTTQAPPTCTPACQNGGTCSSSDVCTCPVGYVGLQCQQPVCSPSCLNGGQCVGPDDCQCPPGYIGESCEQAVCSPSCQNGGQCVGPDDCQCPPGYIGEICDQAVCNPSCQNGGTCSSPNICTCPSSFFGSRCESERVPLHRYFNGQSIDHFYTINFSELGNGAAGYNYEAIQCGVLSQPIPGQTQPLLRYLNTVATDHLYTINSQAENLQGYIFEGQEGHCYPSRATGTVPLHRYYNVAGQDHFYTTNCAEIGTTSAGAGIVNGHRYEGVACYVYPMNIVREQC